MYTLNTELVLYMMFVCVHLLILLVTLTLFVQDGFNALHVACQEGHLRVAECLIDAKANLNLLTNVSTCYKVILTMIHMSVLCMSCCVKCYLCML